MMSIFGGIDFSAYGSWQPLWILSVPNIKNMGVSFADPIHNFELLCCCCICEDSSQNVIIRHDLDLRHSLLLSFVSDSKGHCFFGRFFIRHCIETGSVLILAVKAISNLFRVSLLCLCYAVVRSWRMMMFWLLPSHIQQSQQWLQPDWEAYLELILLVVGTY